jgi:hypothetical protein
VPVPRSRLLAAAIVVAALAGCGTSANPDQAQPGAEGREVAATDLATIAGAYRTIRERCEGLADARATGGAVVALVRVFRANPPDALADFNDARTPLNLRGTLRDAAAQLQRCGAASEAARLRGATG